MDFIRPDSSETDLRVFNTAKLFAENILFPTMALYQTYRRQADFGHQDLTQSLELPEEIRMIERYNGLKAMADMTNILLISISSTVRIKNNKAEVEKLNEMIELSEKIKHIFQEKKERFFILELRNTKAIEVLNRDYFNQIRKLIDICYVNTEMLMTRNRLLFADRRDEFMNDEEVKNQIKQEYIEC